MSLPFVVKIGFYIIGVETLTDDEKLLISRVRDAFNLCEKYASPRFTSFLDGAMQNCIKENVYPGENAIFFGGFEGSERQMLGVFPEWILPDISMFPISVVKIEHKYGSALSHRDYLGSIMSLGIERSKTGDILVDGNTAYVLAESDICDYIKNNISKIGNKGVSVSVCEIGDITLPERKFQIMNVVAASMRLDAVVAAVTNSSRANTAKLIDAGKVNVNHKEITKVAYEIKKGDLLSIRGFGRVIVDDIGTNTRSGRLHIIVKKYI